MLKLFEAMPPFQFRFPGRARCADCLFHEVIRYLVRHPIGGGFKAAEALPFRVLTCDYSFSSGFAAAGAAPRRNVLSSQERAAIAVLARLVDQPTRRPALRRMSHIVTNSVHKT